MQPLEPYVHVDVVAIPRLNISPYNGCLYTKGTVHYKSKLKITVSIKNCLVVSN